MATSNRPEETPAKENNEPVEGSDLSAPLLIFATALDTTWRIFVPVLGGTFAGIGLDHLFSTAPILTIICLMLGAAASGWLITRQLRTVRKNLK